VGHRGSGFRGCEDLAWFAPGCPGRSGDGVWYREHFRLCNAKAVLDALRLRFWLWRLRDSRAAELCRLGGTINSAVLRCCQRFRLHVHLDEPSSKSDRSIVGSPRLNTHGVDVREAWANVNFEDQTIKGTEQSLEWLIVRPKTEASMRVLYAGPL